MKSLLLMTLMVFISTNLMADSPIFLNSLEDSQAMSKISQKDLIVIFGSSSCKYCEELKSDINSGDFDSVLTNKIVCYVELNENNKQIKTSYKINIIPDSRFFVNDKQESKIVGYEKSKYQNWLKNIK